MKAKSITVLHIFAIVGIGFILTIPAIFHGVFEAQDLILYHLKWSKYFSEQFWSGDLYPRWLLGMNAGLGSPTFFFYAPIPYYFTSLFHPLFANDPQGCYQLSLSASFALIASGLTAYIWLKSITNKNAAFISSIVYMVLPYHLAVDLYWRFAFAEYWTFVWIPLILYFSKKIINGHKLNIILLAIVFALLAMTHLPTLIMFSLVPIFYVLSIAGRRQRKKALIRIVVAMILGIGLSAIYWLPAMTTQEYISMNAIQEGMYFYGTNFLHFLHEHEFWTYLGIITLLMGGLAYCAFSIARTNPSRTFRHESYYWIVVTGISIFMMVPLSKPLWAILPMLQRIQFPWRFNTVLTVATTTLLALGISSKKQPVDFLNNKKVLAIAILLIASLLSSVVQVLPLFTTLPYNVRLHTVLAVTTTALLAVGISFLKQPVYFYNKKTFIVGILLCTSLLLSSGLVIKDRLYNQVDVDTELKISMDASEYRPRWVPQQLFQQNTINELGKNSPVAGVTVGQGNILIQQWKPREIVLQANATTDILLTLHQFYYSGWTARLKGESRLLPVQPSDPEGLLSIKVPRGKHEVIVTLDAGVEERAGQIISAVSALVAVFATLWFRRVEEHSVRYVVEGQPLRGIQNSKFKIHALKTSRMNPGA